MAKLTITPAINSANVAITGGTINNTVIGGVTPAAGAFTTLTTNGRTIPSLVGKSSIPFISISSGSVAANGAISGITALPRTISDAYCYFPANALATSIAAGWYYCTFSSTTAGTAFLNTYTSGIPTIPSSPTAVTDGRGAFTGDTNEEFAHTIAVSANAMGLTGGLRFYSLWSCNNNANVKTIRTRFSGNAGTIIMQQAVTSQASCADLRTIYNTNATNAQIAPAINTNGGFGINGAANITSNADTTAITTLVFSVQKATATDNLILEASTVELLI